MPIQGTSSPRRFDDIAGAPEQHLRNRRNEADWLGLDNARRLLRLEAQDIGVQELEDEEEILRAERANKPFDYKPLMWLVGGTVGTIVLSLKWVVAQFESYVSDTFVAIPLAFLYWSLFMFVVGSMLLSTIGVSAQFYICALMRYERIATGGRRIMVCHALVTWVVIMFMILVTFSAAKELQSVVSPILGVRL